MSALILAAAALSACNDSTSPINIPAPGKIIGLPPGVHRVSGSCSGKITLTPFFSTKDEAHVTSYPLVYDCKSQSFAIPDVGQHLADHIEIGDLTLANNRYYLSNFRRSDLARIGRYSIFDLQGRELRRVEVRDMDDHDFILEDTSYTYMKYVPDLRLDACGKAVPEELELVQEDFSDRKLWSWSSLGRLRPEWQVSEVPAKRLRAEPRWKKLLRPIRDCYTMLALMLVDFDTPTAFVMPGEWPLFQVELIDYIHANSIAWVGRHGHMLVSARHLDTVFMIERATGNIIWALGGPMSRMTERRPVGDPGGGFSHQHGAIIRNNVLYLFDNGNNLPGRPSRVVAYAVNADEPGDARFLYQFTDPGGLRRPSEGSVEPLPSGQILVGWGRPPEGEEAPQRAVSIFDPTTKAEDFSIDFNPGWSSYRAKHSE